MREFGDCQVFVQLHERIPLGFPTAAVDPPDSPVRRDQNASQHAGQMLAALGVAAQPEQVVGGAAGQVAACRGSTPAADRANAAA